MIYGVDSNVLVYRQFSDLPQSASVDAFFEDHIYNGRNFIALTPTVLFEFLHIVSDKRRFERPLTFAQALDRGEQIWHGKEVVRLELTETTVTATIDLLREYRLGRNRILDTALAATLLNNNISHLLTANVDDFTVFPFLKVINPTRS